jgi:HEAT repeat protein
MIVRGLPRRLAVTVLAALVLLSGCSRDPVKQALAGLRRGAAPQRRVAAEELGKMKDARAVEPLIAALQDPDDSVAEAAAAALGRIADPRAIRPLAAALQRPATRWSAADALVGLGAPALDTVIAALTNPDVETSKALLPHLKQHNVKDPRLVEPLVRQLRSSDWFVCHSAAESLGRIGDLRAVEPLASALRDDNRMVQEEVARVLGEMGDRRAVDALLIALRELDTAEAARPLGKLGDPRALEPLATTLHGDDIGMRGPAAEGLGLMRDPRALEVLLAEILNWELRIAAKVWGNRHKYAITPYGGSRKTSWGAWQ